MTWNELIDRLTEVQKKNGHPKTWIVDRIEEAGHPPKAIWRAIAHRLGFTKFWADNWKWIPGQDTEEPDIGAIDWQKWQENKTTEGR
jgi:hypothetical protein